MWHAHGPAECLLANLLVKTNIFDSRATFQLLTRRPPLLRPFGMHPQHLQPVPRSCLKNVPCLDGSTQFSVYTCEQFSPFPWVVLEAHLQDSVPRQVLRLRSSQCLAGDVAASPKTCPRRDDSTVPALRCSLSMLVGSSQGWGGGAELEAALCF